MKQPNRINADDIRKVASMSDSELKKKLADIISTTDSTTINKLLAGVNIDGIKKQIQTKNPEVLAGFMNNLSRVDKNLVDKIKNSLK